MQKDERGRILFTRDDLVARRAHFVAKIGDYQQRIENATAEVARIDEQLSSKLVAPLPQPAAPAAPAPATAPSLSDRFRSLFGR
jgi:hypothetical protein